MTPRAFVQLVLCLLFADGFMAVAERSWRLDVGPYLLLWLVLSLLLFLPVRRLYP